jgi:hypothetical protein
VLKSAFWWRAHMLTIIPYPRATSLSLSLSYGAYRHGPLIHLTSVMAEGNFSTIPNLQSELPHFASNGGDLTCLGRSAQTLPRSERTLCRGKNAVNPLPTKKPISVNWLTVGLTIRIRFLAVTTVCLYCSCTASNGSTSSMAERMSTPRAARLAVGLRDKIDGCTWGSRGGEMGGGLADRRTAGSLLCNVLFDVETCILVSAQTPN